MAKFTKDEVDYKKGVPEHHCGICEYYRHGTCLIVEGPIEPDYGCKKFVMGLPATIRKAAMYKGPNGPNPKA
jgi:hypothetical protein